MIFDSIWVQLNTIIPYVALLSFFVTIATLIANILATIKNTKAKEAEFFIKLHDSFEIYNDIDTSLRKKSDINNNSNPNTNIQFSNNLNQQKNSNDSSDALVKEYQIERAHLAHY